MADLPLRVKSGGVSGRHGGPRASRGELLIVASSLTYPTSQSEVVRAHGKSPSLFVALGNKTVRRQALLITARVSNKSNHRLIHLTEMAPRNKENSSGNRKKKVVSEEDDDEDYRRRRDRNNQAVKRSRVKSKMRTQQTLERVNQLKTENELLEEKIKMLTKELGFLKDLFLAHAGSNQHAPNLQDVDLNALLAEDSKMGDPSKSTSRL